MSLLNNVLNTKQDKLCSVFFSAGFPGLNDTKKIIQDLDTNGVDFIEVGLPYSDPMADGETIQYSSAVALKNGINLRKIVDIGKTIYKNKIFITVEEIRKINLK